MRPSPDEHDDDAFATTGGAIDLARRPSTVHSGLPSAVEREHVALVGADDDERMRPRPTPADKRLPASMRHTVRAGRGIDAHERAVAAAA